MGALIVSRHPRHRLGWLLSRASLLSVTLAAEAYSAGCSTATGRGRAYWAHVAAWAAPLLGWPAFTALIMVFLTRPGRPPAVAPVAVGRAGSRWSGSACTRSGP